MISVQPTNIAPVDITDERIKHYAITYTKGKFKNTKIFNSIEDAENWAQLNTKAKGFKILVKAKVLKPY